MNKTAIKNFAMWARKKLISEITYKAGLVGITEMGISNPHPSSTDNIQFFDIGTQKPYQISNEQINQRQALAEKIREKEITSDYRTAFEYIIEEVAYTWFNRLIAIRFMEVNEYLPSKIRVLSSETKGKSEPDMVTTPFDTDMEFGPYEKDRIIQLKHENRLDELFRMLFIKQCNQLGDILPELFEKTNDYTELLLSINFTDSDGIVSHLVNDIDEADFAEAVEIIGWMYQYYNEDRKNQIINIYKGTIKKDDIPAATQLFTTDWVVRYMVDNSLGRYWIERNPQSKLKDKLEYFVTPKDGVISNINQKISPEELTFFDPCMGSGHILVYAFDVLMEIYRECGYLDREAAQAIINNNLFGLDIDDRAYQLAYFALMMKARSYDRKFFGRNIQPEIASVSETNILSKFTCDGVTEDEHKNEIGEYLVSIYKDAKELGSLISVSKHDYDAFAEYLKNSDLKGQLTIDSDNWKRNTMPLMKKVAKQASIMSGKYTVVCTNPPYMNKMEGQLKRFVTENYKPYSGDLFSVFIYRNFEYCKPDGYSAFMTPFVWMFIKTYEQLREYIINNKSITTLVQMEYSAFEEATVPICTFVLRNSREDRKGLYFKLSDFKGGMEVQRKKVLEAIYNKDCGYFYETKKEKFSKIPGSPIAYWVSEKFVSIFEFDTIEKYSLKVCKGGFTGNNDKYLRFWFEVCYGEIPCKWNCYSKGGSFRKWYGNSQHVIYWFNDGFDLKNDDKAGVGASKYYGKEHFVWSGISSGYASFRYDIKNTFFDDVSPAIIFSNTVNWAILGLCNSMVVKSVLEIVAPTMHFQAGDIKQIPVKKEIIDIDSNKIKQNISISKNDWDSFETSWDFKSHPLLHFGVSVNSSLGSIKDNEIMAQSEISIEKTDNTFKIYEKNVPKNYTIESAFDMWKDNCEQRFNQLKSNEEELNRIFIDIYGLQDELTPDVEDKDVTVRKADLGRDIRSFISYAVGCMFGRYSLDVEGLAYAGGEWDDSRYTAFIPDRDNCIPVTDEEYFEDDIVGRFVEFVRCVYGADTLEENLDFIADALGGRGDKSRDIIRNYFLKDFYKDHVKTYQKRPIYWMYDSGKQNGFKALIYMHRYNEDTTGVVRVNYLHEIQKKYMSHIELSNEMAENSGNAREIAQAEKRKEKLVKQLKETREYDEKIAHLAISRIAIDLDDGVKVNYEKVQTAQDSKKLEILAKI